jgi:hypothetical protein
MLFPSRSRDVAANNIHLLELEVARLKVENIALRDKVKTIEYVNYRKPVAGIDWAYPLFHRKQGKASDTGKKLTEKQQVPYAVS